jgi:hypothetical protein
MNFHLVFDIAAIIVLIIDQWLLHRVRQHLHNRKRDLERAQSSNLKLAQRNTSLAQNLVELENRNKALQESARGVPLAVGGIIKTGRKN